MSSGGATLYKNPSDQTVRHSANYLILYSLLYGPFLHIKTKKDLVLSCHVFLHYTVCRAMLSTLKYGIKIVFLTNLSCRYVSKHKKFKKPSAKYSFPTFRHPCAKKWSCATKFQLLNKSWKRQEGAWIILAHFPFKYEIFQKTVP